MSVSRGMWSLKSSTELTRKGMWHDNTWRNRSTCEDITKWLTHIRVSLSVTYVSQSFLSQRAEGQDDSDDGHPLQHAVHSYQHTQTHTNTWLTVNKWGGRGWRCECWWLQVSFLKRAAMWSGLSKLVLIWVNTSMFSTTSFCTTDRRKIRLLFWKSRLF